MLTISQEFLLLGMKPGKYFSTTSHLRLGLVTAGLMDLALDDIILIENQKIYLKKALPAKFDFLSSIFEVIAKKEGIKLTKLSEIFALKNKEFKQLKIATENSIKLLESASESQELAIERMRREFLTDSLTNQTIILAVILHKNKQLKKYFSKHEMTSIKQKIKDLKQDDSQKVLNTMINNIDALSVVIMSSAII